MIGKAADSGIYFWRAYNRPAILNPIQPVNRAARKAPSLGCIGIILASGLAPPVLAQEPPADLARRVAHVESETQHARDHYTYRQSVTIEEVSDHGGVAGQYHEVRDVIFSPREERSEEMVGRPLLTLKNL